MGKGYNYRPRTKIDTSTSQRKDVRTVEQVIRKVEKDSTGNVEKLKITTTNGTRVEISQTDYSSRHWHALWYYLSEGDVVKIQHYAGKIQKAYVEVDQQYFLLLQTSYGETEELLLTLKDANGKMRTAKINERDIENEKMSSEDGYGMYYDYAQTCEHLTNAIEWDESIDVTILGERVAMIEFEAHWWDD